MIKKNQKVILIVDDEPDLLELLCIDIKMEGYQVLSANSGQSAIEVLKTTPVDLIVSDQNMPNGTGLELLKHAKKIAPELPFILFVTCGTARQEFDAYTQGCEGILGKPFETDDLIEKIDRYLMPAKQRWSREPKSLKASTVKPLKLQFDSFNKALSSHQISIGRGGISLHLKELPSQIYCKSLIDIQIDFSDHTPSLIALTQLVWIEIEPGYQWGLEILKMPPNSLNWYLTYLDSKKPLSYIPPATYSK